MQNPFNVTFGELPTSLVSRENEINLIKNTFNNEKPESKVFIITGTRGSGKTVLLTYLANEFKKEDYIVIDLNPLEDMSEQFASKLYDEGKLRKLFLHPEFSFSFKGINLSIKGDIEINNISTLIEKMLMYLKSKNKRVLITLDDVSITPYVKSFIFSYQQMIRNGFDIFLLMNGLYENVSELERNKSLTFFIRAPKINLEPLNLLEIAYLYKNLLSLDEKDAIKYSKLTKGYAYGYQLIGSLVFKNGTNSNILDEYDMKLIKNSYLLTWEKLTKKEKEFLIVMSETKSQKEIAQKLNMSNGNLQTYKTRLIEKGLIESKERGKVDFVLPRFKNFILLEKELNSDEEI